MADESSYPEAIASKLEALPPRPGCYVFRDEAGGVLYVGKAKSLRARVRSYFQPSSSDVRYFIPFLRGIVGDLETMVTATEKEAAVLENDLIKQYQPKFNVKLRDDKDFLCLRLSREHAWPRLELVRRPSPDGARYFGPYHSATNARRTLHLVNKHFQLRTCTDSELKSRKRPCLQYQIKRCPGPCVYDVDAEAYRAQLRSVELFLDGRHDELSKELEDCMAEASEDLEFELAAVYRDQLRAVQNIREQQRVVSMQKLDQDALGIYRQGELCELVLLQVRQGHVVDSQSFSLDRSELPDEELVSGFLTQHYAPFVEGVHLGTIPDEVLVPCVPDAIDGLAEWLGELRGKRVKVFLPQRGAKRRMVEMANDNAEHAFREKQRASDELEARLAEVQRKLRLPTLPRVIECCDISHHGGGDAVGAIVCIRDGDKDKKRYRSFNVTVTDEGDDYAAIYEVLARRFRRGRQAAEDGTSDWELPDLFVVDGGRGQLNVALTAARDLGLHDLSIVGLAKERENLAGEKLVDRVYLPGQKNGIQLRPTSASLYMLAMARDEAHRFANRGREGRGKKRNFRSELDSIKGIGPVAKKALLRDLGSMKAIKAASDAQVLAIDGVSRRHLTALRKVVPAPAPEPAPGESEEAAAADAESVADGEDERGG